MRRSTLAAVLAPVLAAVLLVGNAGAQRRAATVPPRWIATWGTALHLAEGDNVLPIDRATPDATAITLRQIVHGSAGGTRVRVRFSNAMGRQPLPIGGAGIALASATGTSRTVGGIALRFAGRSTATIPAGAEIYSDPVDMALSPGSDLAISLYLPATPQPQTGHNGARSTGFVAPGDQVAATELTAARAVTRWSAIADVEVQAAPAAGDRAATIVAIGDSITDGHGVLPDTNARWTDFLAARLRGGAATRGIGVVNAGISGNRILLDGSGPNLLARFDRDVIARSGVRWAILLAGINDLGMLTRAAPATPAQHAAIVADLCAAYTQLAARAHAHGIRLIGGTVMPFAGNPTYHPDAANEADRQAINRFIRTAGVFDAVIDFDAAMRDPARPDRLAPAYDSGDHLHPSAAGYRAMGEAVPLSLFGGRDAPRRADPAPVIAITFDDIPVHGPLPAGQTRTGVIRGITRALAAADAPAFGFLNAANMAGDADAQAAVAAWRAAGLPIGNHGWSHASLDKIGADAFATELARNEPALAAAAGSHDWHWFRYPFLAEGSDPAGRDAARATLRARGYRIAAVTMGFADYDWQAPYAACVAKGDTGAITRLEAGFLADARTAALSARARAQARLGRDVPYVLLIHVGAFDARMMPRLLAMYRSMGFGFTTLAAAQRDPVYAAAMDLSRPGPTIVSPDAPAPLAGPPAGICG